MIPFDHMSVAVDLYNTDDKTSMRDVIPGTSRQRDFAT